MVAHAPDPAQLAEVRAQATARKRAVLIDSLSLVVHVGDREWRFEGGQVTARHVSQLRRVLPDEPWVDPVWHAVNYLVVNAPHAPADIVARVVFLACLQAGDPSSFDEILDSIPLSAPIWVDLPEKMPDLAGEVAFPDPPSSGGGSAP